MQHIVRNDDDTVNVQYDPAHGTFDIVVQRNNQWVSVYFTQGEEGYADCDNFDTYGFWWVYRIVSEVSSLGKGN